jgi:CubicO group peptidase (beta-lactamase class C family)
MTTRSGTCFKYNNSGFVLFALLAERATRDSFSDLVDTIICRPPGLTSTAFLRTDELLGDTAIGYLHSDGLRTDVLHLPVRGGGDGGIYTNATDISRFWRALLDGRFVEPATVELIVTRHGTTPGGTPYGLGFRLDPTSVTIRVEGYDAGVSFRSDHQPTRDLTWTVLANTSDGAWPVADQLAELLATRRRYDGPPLDECTSPTSRGRSAVDCRP